MFQLKYTPTFEQDVKKLDSRTARRVINKMKWLAEHPELLRFKVRHLPKHLDGLQKYQVGDWRVLFWVDYQNEVIKLYGVDHRGQVYKRLGK